MNTLAAAAASTAAAAAATTDKLEITTTAAAAMPLKVPKLIDKNLLSNSRERGPLPVGPHPRLLFEVRFSECYVGLGILG